MDNRSELPIYMRSLSEDREVIHYYGVLKYDVHDDNWIIEGEPVVCQYAKRIFPGSSGRGSGRAKFKNNKRNVEDLKWLMSRFPLKIENLDQWETSYLKALEHVEKKLDILKRPLKEDSGSWFKGDLKEFQKEGLSFLMNYAPCLLADEMGLGKTIEALAWVSKLSKKDKGIFVLPKNIINQWKENILKFTEVEEDKIHIVSGLTPYEIDEDIEIVLIHYGLLRGWKKELPLYHFDYLVFDEIQELRHKGTEKYSAASLLAESVEKRIGMSGTPIYNTGGEIWNSATCLSISA